MTNVGTNLELVGTQFTFDPARGETLTQVYEGSAEGCVAKGMELRETRPDLSFVIEPADLPLWRISIRAPDFRDEPAENEVITTYELLGNDLQKNIYEAPFVGNANADQVTAVKNHFNLNPVPEGLPQINGAAITDSYAIALYRLVNKGVQHWFYSQYVFRVTSLLSGKSSTRVSYSNVNRVYSQAQIIIGIPSTLLFAVGSIPMPDNPDTSTYTTGWLKKTPTLTQVGPNKFTITQEFWLDAWATIIYPVAVIV